MKPRQYARRARTIQRATILTRVSSDSQSDNTSHETQFKVCQEFCQRRGWEIAGHFEEVESGALYLSRLETQAAIEHIETNQADALVLYDMSRYGRDVEYQHKILKRIIKAGGQLQFASFPLEYDKNGELTPESEQMFTLLGGTSSAERKYIRRRLESGKARKVEQGIQVARGYAPYGWRIVDKKSVIREEFTPEHEGYYFPLPDLLKIVKPQIFEPYAAGASLAQLADRMNAQGIDTPRTGKFWRPCTIRSILQNPVYMGKPAYGRTQKTVDDERVSLGFDKFQVRPREMAQWQFLDTPAIRAHFARSDIAPFLVPESVWWECQERIATNRTVYSGRKDRKYPLSGLITCECGHRVVGQFTRNYPTKVLPSGKRLRLKDGEMRKTFQYVCADRASLKSHITYRCSLPVWNAAILENLVYDALSQLVSKPRFLMAAQEAYLQGRKSQAEPVNPRAIQKRIEDIEKKELIAAESKIEARFAGTSTSPFDAMLVKLASEKAALVETLRISETHQVHQSAVTLPLEIVDGNNLELLRDKDVEAARKNELLRMLIAEIRILPAAKDAPYKSRASGMEIRLRTDPRIRGVLTIRRTKSGQKVDLVFSGVENEE